MKNLNNFFLKILSLNIYLRKSFILIIDFFSLVLSYILSLNIVYGISFFSISSNLLRKGTLLALIGVCIFISLGQYRSLTRFITGSNLYRSIFRNLFFIVVAKFIFSQLNQVYILPFWIILFLISSILIVFSRIFICDLLFLLKRSGRFATKNIAIYGAGNAGAQLANSLKFSSSNIKIKFFIDDDPSLWRRNINGIKIFSPNTIEDFRKEIDQIFLAIPSLSPSSKRKIFNRLTSQGFELLIIPSIEEITSGKAKINSVRSIKIEDLLSRNAITSDPRLLGPGIFGKAICVTGAGGSIGSEICRQIVSLKPSKIVLLDISEHNLYLINKELINKNIPKEKIIPILVSASNFKAVEKIMKDHNIEVLFHAAAYKHVPLVESNPLEGLYNNIFTTKTICEVAEKLSIKEITLLSSDKAVRPTSIMGVSKRISELIFQAYSEKVSQKINSKSKFSMVRFGNVLGSSGSVVPLFKEQIALGGPVSITHRDITRYFMTIPEAAQLVLQASYLSQGGEIFLLDMGEPVKIFDLAVQMINLSGKNLKNEDNPDGDIDIIFTGLRPGEKLYEELLIDAKSHSTIHPLIFKANENFIHFDELIPILNDLEEKILSFDLENTLLILKKLVPEWNTQNSIIAKENINK